MSNIPIQTELVGKKWIPNPTDKLNAFTLEIEKVEICRNKNAYIINDIYIMSYADMYKILGLGETDESAE